MLNKLLIFVLCSFLFISGCTPQTDRQQNSSEQNSPAQNSTQAQQNTGAEALSVDKTELDELQHESSPANSALEDQIQEALPAPLLERSKILEKKSATPKQVVEEDDMPRLD